MRTAGVSRQFLQESQGSHACEDDPDHGEPGTSSGVILLTFTA